MQTQCVPFRETALAYRYLVVFYSIREKCWCRQLVRSIIQTR